MWKFIAVLGELVGGLISWSMIVSAPLGVWAAIVSGSFFHGVASVILPFYGLIYWWLT